VVLEQITMYFTDIDASRGLQVCVEWRNWIQNSQSMWKRVFAEHKWTLSAETDHFPLYLQHKRIVYDLQRLGQGLKAILRPPDDEAELDGLYAHGILFHKSPQIDARISRNRKATSF